MSKTIVQDVLFKNTAPKDLYKVYMNAGKHSVATGAPVEINDTEGSIFSAHGGYISGKNLRLIINRQIVQTWRAQSWGSDDIDSTFIIHLEQQVDDTMLRAIHANMPDNAVEGLDSGWHKMYWEPIKLLLARKPISKALM